MNKKQKPFDASWVTLDHQNISNKIILDFLHSVQENLYEKLPLSEAKFLNFTILSMTIVSFMLLNGETDETPTLNALNIAVKAMYKERKKQLYDS